MSTKTHYFAVLKNSNFLKLWASQVFSQVSMHMLNFILIMRVFELTKTSIFVSFLALCIGAPSVLFGLIGGSIVDRMDRRKILFFSNILQAATIVLYIFAFDHPGMLCLVAFIYNTLNQLYIPAEGAMIPSIVKKRELLTANSLFMFTIYGAYIGGYALAGPLIQIFGNRFPFYLTFLFLTLASAAVFLLPEQKVKAFKIHYHNILSKIKNTTREGVSFLWNKKEVLYPTLSISVASMTVSTIIILIPAFTSRVLKIPVEASSYTIVGPAAIGMLLGAVLVVQLAKKFRRETLATVGVVGGGIILILLATMPYLGRFIKLILTQNGLSFSFFVALNAFILTGVLAVILGFANALVVTPSQTLIQEGTPPNLRGRVLGSLNMINNIVAFFPVILAGFIADLFSVATVFVMVGILLLAFGIKRMKYYQDLKNLQKA